MKENEMHKADKSSVFDKKCSDVSFFALETQVKLYGIENRCSFTDGTLFFNCNQNEKIALGGDNLLTRKRMYRNVFKKNECTCNEDKLYGYILFPRIIGDANSYVNVKRANVGGYFDNPFVFFETLKKMYDISFNDEGKELNIVERSLVVTRSFWKSFGDQELGYNTYLNTFGLNCIKELKKQYRSFFSYGVDLFGMENEYEKLLSEFMNMRLAELSQKLAVR